MWHPRDCVMATAFNGTPGFFWKYELIEKDWNFQTSVKLRMYWYIKVFDSIRQSRTASFGRSLQKPHPSLPSKPTPHSQAHLPSNAISPAPRHINPNAPNTTVNLALRIVSENINSCAMSSTKPV